MSKLKAKDIQKMGKEERMKKIEELKFELIKAKTHASKTGTSKAKAIKRTIARILTLNRSSELEIQASSAKNVGRMENKNSKKAENDK